MERIEQKHVLGTLAATALLMAVLIPGMKAEAAIQDIALDISDTPNPNDHPVGIDCTDPDSVFVTLFNQGAIMEIDKSTKQVIRTFNDPRGNIATGQDFYSLTRDSVNNYLFVNQANDGLIWRLDPATGAWKSKAIVENIDEEDNLKIEYILGYEQDPTAIRFLTSQGSIGYDESTESFEMLTFADGWVWGTLSYHWNFANVVNNEVHDDMHFSGLVKIHPENLDVFRIPLPGTSAPSAVHIDSSDNNIIWVADRATDKLIKFNLTTESIVQTIGLPAGSNAHNLATDDTNIYVPLGFLATPDDGRPDFSMILKINKATPSARQTINTFAPNTGEGTFSVFLDSDNNLRFTDLNGHVGFVDIEGKGAFFERANFADSNHFGCAVGPDNEFFWAAKGSAHVGVAEPEATAFEFNITGKVKKDGSTAKRDVTVHIEGDYGCNSWQRVNPIQSSLDGTITMTGWNGGTRDAKVTFKPSGAYAFTYVADAGSWGKVSGKITLPQVQDCHNDIGNSFSSKNNAMTLVKNGVSWKLLGWTDNSSIQYLE